MMANANTSLLVALETQEVLVCSLKVQYLCHALYSYAEHSTILISFHQIVLSESSEQSFDAQSGFVKKVLWGTEFKVF